MRIKTRKRMNAAEREANDREWLEDQARLAAEPPLTPEESAAIDAAIREELNGMTAEYKHDMWENRDQFKKKNRGVESQGQQTNDEQTDDEPTESEPEEQEQEQEQAQDDNLLSRARAAIERGNRSIRGLEKELGINYRQARKLHEQLIPKEV